MGGHLEIAASVLTLEVVVIDFVAKKGMGAYSNSVFKHQLGELFAGDQFDLRLSVFTGYLTGTWSEV